MEERGSDMRVYATLLAALMLLALATPFLSSAEYYAPDDFAARLEDYLRRRNLLPAASFPGKVRVLPMVPGAELDVAGIVESVNGTPVWLISGVKVAGRSLVSYRDAGGTVYNLSEAVRRVFDENDMYRTAIDTFYATLMVMREGVSPNTYDPVRPPGIQGIDLPEDYSDLVSLIKPELVMVVIGLCDHNISRVRGPIAVYYFAFTARVILGNGVPTQGVFVVAVAVDPNGVLYGDLGSTSGYVVHILIGEGRGFGFFQVLIVYGGLGVFVAVVSPIIKPDDRDKYYLVLFALIVFQLLSLVILIAATQTSIYAAFNTALYLRQWLVFLLMLWLPSYLLAAYYYYSVEKEGEEPGSVSEFAVTPVGIMAKILPVFFSLTYFMAALLMPDTILLWLSGYVGADAFYLFFIVTALVIAHIGLELGRTVAQVSRWRRMRFY